MTLLTNVRPLPVTGPADAFSSSGSTIRGEVRFVSSEERTGLHGAITPRGLLAVEITDPPWFEHAAASARRGKLRDAIEWAIETALEANGAPPAGMSDAGDLDQDLSDQLFRARNVGARGLALYFPHLIAAGSLSGALDAEDSAVLRWWMAATGERPVVVLLDSANRNIGAYGPPTRLDRLVEAARGAAEVAPPAAVSVVLRPADLSRPPAADDDAAPDDDRADDSFDHATLAPEMHAEHAPPEPPTEHAIPEPPADRAAPEPPSDHAVPEPRDAIEPAAPLVVVAPPIVVAAPLVEEERPAVPLPVKRMFADRVVPLFPRRESLPAKSPAFVEKGRAVAASLDWRGFANELEVARGPKPLTIIERLFMSRYVPLVEAIVRGEADDAARRTAERWAENFAHSYTEGFSALKITGKRPRMVLDAPQICSQIARLHGAKSTQLVLVDAMRFDLGIRIHDRMRDALTSQATCTERLLLWSALPTTTSTQMDLLARGPDALSSRGPSSERDETMGPVRGRMSATLRRIKVGGRDILKLDAVEAHLRESGAPLEERLDAMAEEVATAIAAHARSLAPRTLMFVFGDHGFRMESSESGTLAATSGGASPEEVLVPAFAWLVGDVH